MLARRWSLLSPLVLLAWACGQSPADSGGNNGGTAPTGGSGNPTGGAVNGGTAGAATGGASGTPTGGVSGTPTGGVSGTPTGGASGTPTGGAAGSVAGGAGGAGGASGAAGSGTSGSSTGGTGGSATCTITPTASTAMRIPTVGIVTFTTDLAGMTEAHIDFGRDTNYGMRAPVDLAAMNYRTLLLGMKAATMYHYRIVATGPSGTCTGADQTITTGALGSGLPDIQVTTMNAAALSPGFIITGCYQGAGAGNAIIVDSDGDIVWWYQPSGQRDATGARPSFDGKYMWINNANVPGPDGATMHRVSMDGSMDENLSTQFARMNHGVTVLPDESVVFYAYGSGNCDDVKERSPSGQVRTVANAQTAHGASGPCHINHIEYSAEDDTILFSDLDNDNYTKIRRTNGQTVWVLGGETSDFTGMAMWDNQHGLDVLGLNRFVFFNNGGTGGGSVAIEILLDLGAMTATQPWTYRANPNVANQIMGDVQRMENGNTVVAYSTRYELHEVNATGQLVQRMTWGQGNSFGYIQKRASLYGPPPR